MNDREAMLIEYSNQFKTQGNRDGEFWFLGIEEGGGGSIAEVDSMLDEWDSNGRSEESVLRDPDNPSLNNQWFGTEKNTGRVNIQKTWGAQIRVLLSMKGLPCGTEDVRHYQMNAFGLAKGETCLMELLPLPNPGIDKWIYSSLTKDPRFSSREAFVDHVLKTRISRFIELVSRHQPTAVIGVCYGLGKLLEPHLDDVERVHANKGNRPGRAIIGNIGGTVVAITYHPNTPMTAPNAWYEELGQLVADRSDSLQSEPLRVQLPLPFAA